MTMRRGARHRPGDFLPDTTSHAPEDERVRIVGLGHGDRRSAVGGLADPQVERHLAEKLGAEPLGLQAGAAVAEDLAATSAMRAQEIAHVLDDPEHRHVDLLEHVEPLAGVEQGDVRRLAQRLQLRSALALDLDREGDIAVADDEARDHAEGDDIGAPVGIGDMAQSIEDLSFGDATHFILSAPAGAQPAGNPSIALGF